MVNVKRGRNAVIILVCAAALLIFYYFITNIKQQVSSSYLLNHSLHKDSSETSEECEHLYHIARDMLNGDSIKLPFESKQTQWKFHDERNLDLLGETSLRWNYKRDISNKTQQFINFYKSAKSKDIKRKKYFITFAHNCCNHSKMKAIMCALYPGGFDDTRIHDLNSLSNGFRQRHAHILSQKQGSGYWLWKPYIILKTLVENLEDGDFVMYQDSGAYLIKDAGPLLKLCEDTKYGILLFYLTLLEKHYTKRDTFILMGMDDNRVHKTFQRLASFLILRKSCKSLQFVMEWLAYASDPHIIMDTDNKMGKKNLPGFKEHRHDQSVLSLLSKKWGLYAFRTPSQYGNPLGYSGGPYEQIILHNRDRS